MADESSNRREKGKNPEGQGEEEAPDERDRRTPFWEWAIAAVGLVLVMGAIGFMVYEGMAGDVSPPAIVFRTESVQSTSNGYLVIFHALNEGGTTAEQLVVHGELRDGARSVEVSEITINFVPSHSQREGGLFFTNDPREHELQLRAEGYERP